MLHKPNLTQTYTTLLQTCTNAKALLPGKQIHANILKSPLLLNPCSFLLNTLLNMYCKCNDSISARKVFDTMPTHNSVSYNLLISGFSNVGLYDSAICMFLNAMCSDVKLDKFTYASGLGVCAKRMDFDMGRVIHGMVVVSGLYKGAFLTNSLIDMYVKCEEIEEARQVFCFSDELDVISWNSIVSGHEKVGEREEALRFFVKMVGSGVELNACAVGSVLKSCSSLNVVEFGKLVHACVGKVGLDLDIVVGSAFVDMYAKNGFLGDAMKFSKLMPFRNEVVFNAMLTGFSKNLEVETPKVVTSEVLGLYLEMQREGIKPSKFTFSGILKACNLYKAFELGKQIHGQVIKANLQEEEFIGSALIDLYSDLGSIEDGLRCFNSIPKHDIVILTSMISGCVSNDQNENALRLFHELLAIGRRPDLFTMSSVMSACANLAMATSGEQIHSYSIKAGFNKRTIYCNSQISMYAKSGDINASSQTFLEVEDRDVISWSAMISSHAHHGCANDALRVFKEMKDCSIAPNEVTFLGVLTACSHEGFVDEGLRYFKSMKSDYNINPNVKHYSCIVDLLSRSGRLSEAEDFLLDSSFKNDPIMWRALLGSCKIHKDTDRGARVAARIIELDPNYSSSYVLLYNLYLDSGEISLAMRARDLMKEKGVKKEPGLSWIEFGATVHSFVAGDKSHPLNHAIYSKLNELMTKIEKTKESLVNCHSEKLAVAFGMICLPQMAPIRVMKNLRICGDCHKTIKMFSEIEKREIVVRDVIRFHHFKGGSCSCGDYW